MLETTEKGGFRNSIKNCLTVFRYDPLLRVPHRQELPHYDPKDFSLED